MLLLPAAIPAYIIAIATLNFEYAAIAIWSQIAVWLGYTAITGFLKSVRWGAVLVMASVLYPTSTW